MYSVGLNASVGDKYSPLTPTQLCVFSLFSHSWASALLDGWLDGKGIVEGDEEGVKLHSFHWGCVSANQVTPSSVPGNWEGRISSVSTLDMATDIQRPVCMHPVGRCVYICCCYFCPIFLKVTKIEVTCFWTIGAVRIQL